MTLRTRLFVSALLLAIVVLAGTWMVADSQKNHIQAEMDSRLETLFPVARIAVKRATEGGRTSRAVEAIISDAWVGSVGPDGKVDTVVAPINVPEWRPIVNPAALGSGPVDVGTSDGGKARLLSRPTGNGDRILIALSSEAGDRTIAQLQRTGAFLALAVVILLVAMVWWVNFLGIAPIERMTDAARRIASGDTGYSVPIGPGDTEATQLGNALNTMISTLRSSDEKIRQFVADASHELRTPLTTLRGYSDLYESGALHDDAMVSDAMRRIRSEADRMTRIIDDLIQLRGMDRLTPTLVSCRLDHLVSECVKDLLVTHHPRTIAVFTEEVTVTCDRHLITQAVMALGTNAMEHTPADTSITVTVRRIPGAVRVAVHDDGPGIPREHLDHLFERLYRVDPARKGRGNHSGIGLSVVATIIAAHGGMRGVDSSAETGTTFWFDLPQVRD